MCISTAHAQLCNGDDVQLAVMDRQEKRLQNCLHSNPELDLRTGAGLTSLNIAATLGQDRIVKMLLQHRFPPQADGQPDESKYAPIHTCVQNGHVAAAKLLISSLKSQPGAIDVRTAGG
jgi:ankyrin repeat protein